MSFDINPEKREIYIKDLGVTFRTIFGVAAEGFKQHDIRQWHVVYKKARIAVVKVKDTHLKPLKGSQSGRHANGNESSTRKCTEKPDTEAAGGTSVAVPESKAPSDGKAAVD